MYLDRSECKELITWRLIMQSFKDNSSRQTEQKSLPPETVINSLENSFALCAALMPFRSDEQSGFFLLVPVYGGGFTHTFRLRICFDCVGAQRWLSSDVGEGEEVCELLPAAWISISLLSVAITIHESHHVAELPVSFN